jgi:HEPN domain-containing protein
MTMHTIADEDFKSHNGDRTFGVNAIYFKYTKPYKVKVEFVPAQTQDFYGYVDVYRFTATTAGSTNFDIRPTRIGGRGPATFEFYANPFYLGLGIGFFEPRVYKGFFNIARIEVTKQFELRSDDHSRYALFLARRARDMLDYATESAQSGDYGLCLHFSRYCIELSLKTIFPAFGETFAKEHDITKSKEGLSKVRRQIRDEMPDFPLEKLLFVSQKHIRPDRVDFYGDPENAIPADMVINEAEARTAFQDSIFTNHECMRLIDKKLKR